MRSTLECANHVQLALSINADQLAEFGAIIERQRAAVAGGQTDEFSELDELMHRRLFEFAGRRNVWAMLEPIKRQFDRVRWLLLGRVADHAGRVLAGARADPGADGGARRRRASARASPRTSTTSPSICRPCESTAPESYFTD